MSERQSKSTQDRHERILNEIVKCPGNENCADCGSKSPRWASYSLGVFLCIRCAGIHRKMGTHVSKVKSITMDQWTTEQIEMMRHSGGNNAVNSKVNPNPGNHPRPFTDDDEHAMERYIRAKWEKRLFLVDNRIQAPTANPINRLQVLPKRSSSVPAALSDPLIAASNQLRNMGFQDDFKNKQVLIQTQGNMEAAIEILTRTTQPSNLSQPLTLSQQQQPSQQQSFQQQPMQQQSMQHQRPIQQQSIQHQQPMQQQHIQQQPMFLTDDQKNEQLMRLGFADKSLNLDALRRAGGNTDIAITILNETKQAGLAGQVAPQQQQQQINFRSNSVPVLSSKHNNLLVDVDTAPAMSHVAQNPFAAQSQPMVQFQPLQQQQLLQQQQYQQQYQQQQNMQQQQNIQQQQMFHNPFNVSPGPVFNNPMQTASNPFSQMTTSSPYSTVTSNHTSYFQPTPNEPQLMFNNQNNPPQPFNPWQ